VVQHPSGGKGYLANPLGEDRGLGLRRPGPRPVREGEGSCHQRERLTVDPKEFEDRIVERYAMLGIHVCEHAQRHRDAYRDKVSLAVGILDQAARVNVGSLEVQDYEEEYCENGSRLESAYRALNGRPGKGWTPRRPVVACSSRWRTAPELRR